MPLTRATQAALYYARKRRRIASHSGPIDVGGVFSFLLEDGTNSILLEDGSFLLMQYATPTILLEDSTYILLENNNLILME